MTAQHLVGFSDETLSLSNAFPKPLLARLDLCCVLNSPLSALLGV